MNAATRRWIYGIVTAVVPLLVLLDVFSDDVATNVILIAQAVLAVGASTLALNNITDD